MNKQELALRIVRDMGYEYQTVRNIIDGIAFEGWLHDPDQVPGRTITEREFQELMEDVTTSYQVGFTDGLYRAGGRVVPDPEPTEAERMLEDLGKWTGRMDTCIELGLPQFLVDQGWTKGRNDDH